MTIRDAEEPVEIVVFDDNKLVAELGGETDAYFGIIEQALDVRIAPRGNRLTISGQSTSRRQALDILQALYRRLERGEPLRQGDVRAAVKLLENGGESLPASGEAAQTGRGERGRIIKTQKRSIRARSSNQAKYLAALDQSDLTFGVGPAGTGKTYLAVAHAIELLSSGRVERIILSRPAVEAGEQIGFLPGDMKDKVDPYMRPLYDALYDMMHTDFTDKRIQSGEIEIAPLAFMRGRTLARAAVILDEAQNATPAQMKMFLTRLGDGSHMAITGDPTQSDLGLGVSSGLTDALSILQGVEGVSMVEFEAGDVVRHPLVSRIINAYDKQKTTG